MHAAIACHAGFASNRAALGAALAGPRPANHEGWAGAALASPARELHAGSPRGSKRTARARGTAGPIATRFDAPVGLSMPTGRQSVEQLRRGERAVWRWARVSGPRARAQPSRSLGRPSLGGPARSLSGLLGPALLTEVNRPGPPWLLARPRQAPRRREDPAGEGDWRESSRPLGIGPRERSGGGAASGPEPRSMCLAGEEQRLRSPCERNPKPVPGLAGIAAICSWSFGRSGPKAARSIALRSAAARGGHGRSRPSGQPPEREMDTLERQSGTRLALFFLPKGSGCDALDGKRSLACGLRMREVRVRSFGLSKADAPWTVRPSRTAGPLGEIPKSLPLEASAARELRRKRDRGGHPSLNAMPWARRAWGGRLAGDLSKRAASPSGMSQEFAALVRTLARAGGVAEACVQRRGHPQNPAPCQHAKREQLKRTFDSPHEQPVEEVTRRHGAE